MTRPSIFKCPALLLTFINFCFIKYVYIDGQFRDKICSFVFHFLPATLHLHHKMYIKIQDF